jgi:hypothetical protein
MSSGRVRFANRPASLCEPPRPTRVRPSSPREPPRPYRRPPCFFLRTALYATAPPSVASSGKTGRYRAAVPKASTPRLMIVTLTRISIHDGV